jgi:hypothetical protein|uniref:Photosystem I assembly protein Ycf4 n=1 Tax=Pseudopedinella elastica TaxID=35684 RepID=A0A516ZAD8_9STRA|nr:photosystem I assembly protein Ycf4 [Pseudopedinella elastica]QDR24674.1 photosystem I assembly protein Ycf4 [Pseudopedinella elastica]|tara:strand:- start:64 stop:711 length:648 start_codon:yes stop_codon:yes gene_type:complete
MNNLSVPSIEYQQFEDGYIVKKEGKTITYCESIKGARQFTNFFWLVLLFLFGIGFLVAGFSSYFNFNFLFFSNFSNIEFIPQGILLLFYGTCAILLSFLILNLINWDIGSGTNNYDIESSVVRLSRRGFPSLTKDFKFEQRNLYLVYPFSDILNLELEIIDGLNPTRVIYLRLKDNRRIPLTPSNQLKDLRYLENRAMFLARLLKTDLKLEVNNS